MRGAGRLRGRRVRLLAVLIVPCAAVVGAGSWLMRDRSGSSATSAPQNLTVAAAITTLRQSVSATGTLAPAHEADLSFGSSGTVTDVNVAMGDRVTAGQVLARIDPTDLEAEVTQAQAAWTPRVRPRSASPSPAGSSSAQIALLCGRPDTAVAETAQPHPRQRPGCRQAALTCSRQGDGGVEHRRRRSGVGFGIRLGCRVRVGRGGFGRGGFGSGAVRLGVGRRKPDRRDQHRRVEGERHGQPGSDQNGEEGACKAEITPHLLRHQGLRHRQHRRGDGGRTAPRVARDPAAARGPASR